MSSTAYLTRQRERWTRPNAHLFVRPDWRRFVPRDQDDHPFALYENKYRPDQPRVPAGNPDGGQWTSAGEGGSGGPEEAELPPNAKPTQYIARERSTVAEMLLSKGGEDVGTFGDRIAIVKGPNISHQENYDPGSGNTILSFSGVGSVAVDENDGSVLTGKVYRVGTPDRPDEGLSIIIDRNGQARAYPTSGN